MFAEIPPPPTLESYQFTLLSVVVAAATYVGTVARGVSTKLGIELKNKSDTSKTKPLAITLGCLVVADILLIILAVMLAIRIGNWIAGNPLGLGYDQTICGVLLFAVVYLTILHIVQWFDWTSRISGKK